MTQDSSDSAASDDRFLERLPREVSRWETGGLITPEQGQAILGSYSPSELAPPSYRAQGRLVTGLSIVGAVLVGLGVILFFAANWDAIGRWPKLGLILAAIIAGHGLGYYLRYYRGYQRVGSAMVLLACIIYGAGVHLVGQVYNVDVNDPNLMLFWLLGVLPLVYIVRSQPIQLLGVVLFFLAVGFRLPDWFDGVSRGEGVLGASLFLILGLFILAVGRLKEEISVLRPYSEVFQLSGMITALGAVFALTFKDMFDSFVRDINGNAIYIQGDTEIGFRAMIAAVGVVTLVLVLATAWLHRSREQEFTITGVEGIAIAILLAAAYVVIGVDTGGEVVYAVVFTRYWASLFWGYWCLGICGDGRRGSTSPWPLSVST